MLEGVFGVTLIKRYKRNNYSSKNFFFIIKLFKSYRSLYWYTCNFIL